MDKWLQRERGGCSAKTCITKDNGYNTCERCIFPFRFGGKTYFKCTTSISAYPWCSTKVDENFNHVTGNWGLCDESKC